MPSVLFLPASTPRVFGVQLFVQASMINHRAFLHTAAHVTSLSSNRGLTLHNPVASHTLEPKTIFFQIHQHVLHVIGSKCHAVMTGKNVESTLQAYGIGWKH